MRVCKGSVVLAQSWDDCCLLPRVTADLGSGWHSALTAGERQLVFGRKQPSCVLLPSPCCKPYPDILASTSCSSRFSAVLPFPPPKPCWLNRAGEMSKLEHVCSSKRGSSVPILLPNPTEQPSVFGSWISGFLCQHGIEQ